MSVLAYTITFIKDTCVLVVVAYLLARGRGLRLLFRERLALREILTLGLALGLIGLTEAIFPDARFPYALHTLFVTFAAIVGGLSVGLVTAGVVTLGAFFFLSPPTVIGTMLAVIVSAFLGRSVRRFTTLPRRLLGGFVVGACAQMIRVLLHAALTGQWNVHVLFLNAVVSVPANGFGVLLLLLVVNDALVRADSEQRRLEAERRRAEAARAQALASQSQLTALRARIHPHFLFNTLNSIAELCCIAPKRAEAASVRLSFMMRRALDTSAALSRTLEEELELVQAYIQIEQERLGERLKVSLKVDPECRHVPAPPFAVQTLVENAIHHGLAPKIEPGMICIIVRRAPRHTLIAIQDDGVGLPVEVRRHLHSPDCPCTHGLQIVNQQLVLQYGSRARLRLLSQEGSGTLVAFALPNESTRKSIEEKLPC